MAQCHRSHISFLGCAQNLSASMPARVLLTSGDWGTNLEASKRSTRTWAWKNGESRRSWLETQTCAVVKSMHRALGGWGEKIEQSQISNHERLRQRVKIPKVYARGWEMKQTMKFVPCERHLRRLCLLRKRWVAFSGELRIFTSSIIHKWYEGKYVPTLLHAWTMSYNTVITFLTNRLMRL